ncbi:MAG: hypothetical protein MUC77_11560 [Chromatiaceae bacterium]|jgi:hypothetical protein|nr:hypothetical protein [Chromatiaceae bacterium]
MKARALVSTLLLVATATAFAGGDTKRTGAPDDSWGGTTNTDDYQRSLIVKCPAGTTPGSVEALPDEQGVVMVVECNNEE